MTTFAVTGADLHEAAAWASRIAPAKPSIALLGGLLLDAGDELTVTAFDFDTCGTATIAATVKEPGQLLVSARLLAAVAKTVARDVDVTVEESGGVAEVCCGRSEWSVPTMSAQEYPQLPVGVGPVATVDAAALRGALARVLPAVSREVGGLASLTGLRVEPSDTGMALVATDRWRLAYADIPLISGTAPAALVPAGLLDSAARAMGSGEVSISCDANTFGLATESHRLIGRQVDAEFPRWRDLVPDPGENFAVVDVAELVRAVEQAQVMSEDAEVAIELGFTEDAVSVAAHADGRRARAEAAVALTGDPAAVQVKPSYLLTALGAMGTSACVVHFYRRFLVLSPKVDGSGTGQYRHLVMHRVSARR
jgi:DNA polymerase III subunit beta